LAEQDGAIVEVNATPGLKMHLYPTQGQPRPVGRPIVEMLYPPGAPGRIPLMAITGSPSLTTVTTLVAHIYETAGRVVGVTTADGAYSGTERLVAGDASGFARARAVLCHPWVEVAVVATAPEDVLREGLAFDRCQVAVVVGDVAARSARTQREHADAARDREEDTGGAGPALAERVVVAAVARDGAAVLDADDPRVAELAAATDGEVVHYSLASHNPLVDAHRARGGRCVFVRGDQIVLTQGRTLTPLLDVSRVSVTAGGPLRLPVQSLLAAAAATAAMGLDPAVIARALSSFSAAASTVTAAASTGSGYVQTSERTSAEV
jgi:cyanophycin synthetase